MLKDNENTVVSVTLFAMIFRDMVDKLSKGYYSLNAIRRFASGWQNLELNICRYLVILSYEVYLAKFLNWDNFI